MNARWLCGPTGRRLSPTAVLLALSLAVNLVVLFGWGAGDRLHEAGKSAGGPASLPPTASVQASPATNGALLVKATTRQRRPTVTASVLRVADVEKSTVGKIAPKEIEEPQVLEPETGSDSAVSSNGPNLLKANAKVMLAVVTGGAKNTTLSNRQAVVDTWFGLESYMVTAEDVGAARVIRLPKEAERGGRSALPKKVKHMWAHLYEHFLDEYDWFMKLDDDTFVHKERLLKTLSVFDPTVPLLLGKSYVTRPSSGAVTGPGAMWKDVDSLTFCHGGAGYIMSRELLRRVGPHLLESTTVTALEDAAIAAACFEVTGARCMNTNLRHFGGIDMVRNSHDQGHILSTVKALELDNRVKLALTATVHSVEAEMTRYLYQMYRRMDADTALSETADRLASRDLEKYRSALVASFNCTLSTPVGAAEPRFVAVCMRSALRWKPRTAPREPPNLATAWALVEGAGRSCQVAPPVRDIGWLAWNADIATPPRAPSPRPTAAAQGPLSANGVMIAVSSAAEVTYLALLLSSLRATGSSAWVAVFFDEARFAALLPALRSATVADCACRLIAWRSDRLRDAFDALSWKTHPSLRHQGYAVMGSYLRSLANKHGHVLMTRPDSFFQRDPFKAMPLRQGLNFFSLDPLRELPLETCFPTKTPPRLTEKLSATFPDTVFGSTSQLTQFLGALLYRKAAPGCSFDDNLSMAVWRKVFASGQPVNVLDPHTSPVVGVFPARGRYRVHDNVALVTNHAGTPAALVSGYAARTLVDGLGQLAVLHPGGAETPLQAALQRHAQLAAGIRLVADYRPLSATQWPAGDKAFSRFQSLGVGQSPSGAGGSEAPEEPFLAVWEALWRSSRFARDPARATVTKVAVPKTHKTGSSTLASVFFRYAARHKLRVWQRGTWTFVPAATFVKPPPPEDKEQYDMHISHLNPRGFFRGPFSKVADFYQHVIGPDVNMVTLVREPRQQYVSWLYYYVVPKMKEGDPMDVLRQFVADGKNKNILSQEFALRDRPTFDTFMKTYFEQFKLIMIAERFDESLVLLRRLFNWDLIDITYMRLLDSNTAAGSKRYDGKPIVPTPKIAKLDPALVRDITRLLPMDLELYAAAVERFDDLVAAQGPGFQEEVDAFRALQATLADTCRRHRQHAICSWYQLTDLEFFRLLSTEGFSPAVPML